MSPGRRADRAAGHLSGPRWASPAAAGWAALLVALAQRAGAGAVEDLGGRCLDDAVAPESLSGLIVDGASMPLGIWLYQWGSAEVMAHLYAVLARDALGYAVAWSGATDTNAPGMLAVAGCDAPKNVSSPQCIGSPRQSTHVILEFWTSNAYNVDWLARHYPSSLPEDVGSVGYASTEGFYVTRAQVRAAAADGVHLEYYGSYDSAWNDLRKYFDDYRAFRTADLLPCNRSQLQQSAMMDGVTKWYADPGSIVPGPNGLQAKCPDGFWWLSPGCRASPSRCLPFITGGDGWYIERVMQRAISHCMPLAVAVAADYSRYVSLPHEHRLLTYWWQPADDFLDLSLVQLVFPTHNDSEWASGNFQGQDPTVRLAKVVYKGFSVAAPRAYKLAQKISIDISVLNVLLQALSDNGGDARAAACGWLRANVATWKAWLPRATDCTSGYGLVDAASAYVSERARAVDCYPCGAGSFAQPLVDQGGVTRVCRACAVGSAQAQRGSDSCESCDAGYFQNETGQSLCQRCDKGTFASAKGSSVCEACPAGKTTDGRGFRSGADCQCAPGSYLAQASGECVQCGEGLVCAGFGSPPMLLPGWMTLPNDPTIYKCDRTGRACPGGVPLGVQACSAGGTDIACSWCLDGYRFDAQLGMCTECTKGNSTTLWVCFAVLAVATAIALRPATVEYGEKTLLRVVRTTFITLTLSQILDVFQICSIWSGSAIRWSSSDNTLLFTIGGLFSFSTMSPDCDVKGTRENHALKIVLLMNMIPAFFITFVLLVVLPDMLSPTLRQWRPPSRINGSNMILGAMVSLFTTVLNLAINIVFSMYDHPGGQRSLRVFPYVLDTSKEMEGLRAVAGCSLAVWCVGTIVAMSGLAVYLQTSRPSLMVRRCTVAAIVRYRDGYNWWLIVELLLKLLVAISIAIFKRPDVQIQWMIIVFVVYLILVAQVKPYRFLRHSLGEIVFTFGKVLVLVLCMTSVYKGGPAESGVFSVLVAIFCLCVLYLLWCLFTLVAGRATEPATDFDTLAVILCYFGYHKDPRCLFEVVPESEALRASLGMSSGRMAEIALERAAASTSSPRVSFRLSSSSSNLEEPRRRRPSLPPPPREDSSGGLGDTTFIKACSAGNVIQLQLSDEPRPN